MSRLCGKDLSIPDSTLYDLFIEQAGKEDANKTVVISQGKEYTLRDLQKLSSQVASSLLERFAHCDVKEPGIICLLLPLSVEYVASVLAILKLGCAFLSLEPSLPQGRVEQILKRSRVGFILTTGEFEGNLSYLKDFSINILDVSTLKDVPSSTEQLHQTLPYVISDNPEVAVLYTSGSTGEPKFVRLCTQNLLNRLMWYWEELPFTPGELCCMKTSVLFVDSITELLGPLLKAIPILIIDRKDVANTQKFLEAIHAEKVTRLVLVPSQLHAMVAVNALDEEVNYLEHLRFVVSSGEELPPSLASSFLQATRSSHCSLYNFYGSTETTGDATFIQYCSPSEVEEMTVSGHLPIGKPISNTNISIREAVSEEGDTLGIREIVISGMCIASSGEEANVSKEYNTRDLGFIKNGLLYYFGRKDHQVKIRGHRIDLREIERVIRESCCSIEAVVVLPHGSAGEQQLVAFYQVKKGQINTNEVEQLAREACQACQLRLPCYMVPRLRKVENMPLQEHTGKTDRKALQKLLEQAEESCPSDPILKVIADVLHQPVDSLNLQCSFFDLGGNSLSAVTVVTRLSKMKLKITLSEFMEASSLQKLLSLIHQPQSPLDQQSAEWNQLYKFEPALKEHKMPLVELFSKEYADNEPLAALLGASIADYHTLFQELFEQILQNEHSFLLRNSDTQEIVACALNVDANAEMNVDFGKYEPVLAIVDATEGTFKDELSKRGPWLDNFMVTVSSSVPVQQKVKLLQLVEEELWRRAKQWGFKSIVTVNSHPVTMNFAESALGYKVESTLHVRSFAYEGRFPFENADDDYHIKLMVRYID